MEGRPPGARSEQPRYARAATSTLDGRGLLTEGDTSGTVTRDGTGFGFAQG
jgi:hypothetical protein